jgi:hypothetical protein
MNATPVGVLLELWRCCIGQHATPGLVVAGLYGPEGSRLDGIRLTMQPLHELAVRHTGRLHACSSSSSSVQ